MNTEIREMIQPDVVELYNAFSEQGWNKPISIFELYYKEQLEHKRQVFIATCENAVAGYATLLANDNEGPYANLKIPTICDFNVLIKYQKQGIGTMILDSIEQCVKKLSDKICLGVGLHSGYGPAQRMYVKRGYIPDGSGVWYNNRILEKYADCINEVFIILKSF